jgi:hypothetical protein
MAAKLARYGTLSAQPMQLACGTEVISVNPTSSAIGYVMQCRTASWSSWLSVDA